MTEVEKRLETAIRERDICLCRLAEEKMARDLERIQCEDGSVCELHALGEEFIKLIENGIKTFHRDTFHAKLGVGRYALGLTWYGYLTGNDVTLNKFDAFDEPVTAEEAEIVKKCVREVLNK